MPKRRPDLHQKFINDIHTEYERLSNEKEGNINKYSNEYIMYLMEQKFYVDKQSILIILRKTRKTSTMELPLT